jgi:hypothetical protein
MIQAVAVECPPAWIISIEGDRHTPVRGDEYRIAHRTREPLVVDRHDLERVPVQVHRMRHRRPVDHDDFDTLALADRERRVLPVRNAVQRPDIAGLPATPARSDPAEPAPTGKATFRRSFERRPFAESAQQPHRILEVSLAHGLDRTVSVARRIADQGGRDAVLEQRRGIR